MATTSDVSAGVVRSLIPARMDRLPWTAFHTRLVMSLGTAWILDGLEITLADSVSGVLSQSDTLHMSSVAIGAITVARVQPTSAHGGSGVPTPGMCSHRPWRSGWRSPSGDGGPASPTCHKHVPPRLAAVEGCGRDLSCRR
jgi:hypothetical protein